MDIKYWKQIKKWIVDNTTDDYSPSQITSEEAVNFLALIITTPIENKDLGGIPELYSSALKNILIDKHDIGINFSNISNIEKLLRKILYIVNAEEYKNQNENCCGLNQLFKALGLDRNHNIFNPDANDAIGQHLHAAYNLRNKESHYCQGLNEVKILSLLQSIFIVYLFAIDENSIAIKKWITNQDTSFQDYLKEVTKAFNKWNRRFIPIDGKEQIHEIVLYAIETDWDKEEERQMREGEVEDLRKELITDGQNQMIIVGEAGTGKTTTMQYLAYRDAISHRMPIYVELKNFTTEVHLEKYIREKVAGLSCDFDSIMQNTNTCIFLDGLNEILPIIKDNIYREIRAFIKKYPDVFFLISSRPQDYKGNFEKIPVFSLQKMDNARIREFLKKNADDENVRNMIIHAIDMNPEWLRLLGTPFILQMLICVVTQSGRIPDDENKIILQFIKGLYEEEHSKDSQFDDEFFHSITCRIAFDCINNVGNTNSGFSFAAIKKYLSEDTIDISDKDLRSILRKGVELNLLVQDGKIYSFSHQLFQDTLAGDYFNTLYAE